MIPVTKPFLPPKKEYDSFVESIWKSQLLTNMGPLARDLEIKLKNYLDVKNILFVSNGTIALQLAIKALGLRDEIITTPFTYVATTSSIVWEGCKPVFIDIDKKTLNIDPTKIENAITKKTTAIIATHVYGNPCDVEAIQKIARKHNLKVIYDAAHAFGVKVNGKSIFEFGDISTCSTHATKLFHTCEGGFMVAKDKEILKTMSYMRNFGHDGPEKFHGLGINAKNSEFHAAIGLCNLTYIDSILKRRKELTKYYDLKLNNFKGVTPRWHNKSASNCAYYPIIFESDEFLLKCIKVLKRHNIFGRRYFYPSLATSLPYIKSKALDNTDCISKRIFCLPLFHDLTFDEVNLICSLLLKTQNDYFKIEV